MNGPSPLTNVPRRPPEIEAGAAAAIMKGRVIIGSPQARFAGAHFDTRRLSSGEMFVAIPGERTDGHLYLGTAASAGARAFLVQRWDSATEAGLVAATGRDVSGLAVIQVDDTVAAFGRLGASHRARFDLPVIGITGSVGKTTVKDMAAHILERSFDVLASEGNLNSDVGMPVILLRLDEYHRVAVLEMAMRGEAQITYLTSLSSPVVGIVASVAPVHIETLGSLEAIARAKAELPRALPADGLAVVDGDSAVLASELARGGVRARTVRFGRGPEADIRVSGERTLFSRAGERVSASLSFDVYFSGHGVELSGTAGAPIKASLPYPGAHNALNAAAAASACAAVGVPIAQGLAALRDFAPKSAMRLDIRPHAGVLLINDAYNANPLSMKAALSIMAEAAGGGRTVAMLGDMLELGELEAKAHRQLGRDAAAAGVDVLITFGPASAATACEAVACGLPASEVHHTLSHGDAARTLLDAIRAGDVLLIKGSRGMALENVVSAFLEGWPR